MIFIADSGSTKTEWAVLSEGKLLKKFVTNGFNPYYQNDSQLNEAFHVAEAIEDFKNEKGSLYFYGAGCSAVEPNYRMKASLKSFFPNLKISVQHDLFGATLAGCGNKPGIVSILGTGSNSCVFDGKNITDNLPNLGFWLGDEGSGAHLGKLLILDYFHKKMPNDIKAIFEKEFEISREELLKRAYKLEFPNRWFAAFSSFIYANKEQDYFSEMIQKSFRLFIELYLLPYKQVRQFPLSFVGSIAWNYTSQLEKALESFQLKANKITKSPIDGLIQYHLQEYENSI